MAKTKKALSLVLAIVMALSILAFNSFAASETAKLDVTADKTSNVKANDNVTFTVKITNNYFLGVASVPLKYDAAIFEFVSYSVPDTIFTKSGATLKEIKHTPGMATVSIFADTNVKGALAQKFTAATTLFTITLKAKVDINADATVAVNADQRTMANPKGELFLASISGADVTDDSLIVNDLGQVITTTGATISGGGSVQQPALTLSANGAANGVIIDKVSNCTGGAGFVYGINTDTGDLIADQFTTPAGSIRVNANEQGNMSTGATVELLNASGVVVETYTFVFFGDVNGDAFMDAADVSIVDAVGAYMDFSFEATDGSAVGNSADINGDGFVDAADVSMIDAVAAYADFSTQADFAAIFAAARGVN